MDQELTAKIRSYLRRAEMRGVVYPLEEQTQWCIEGMNYGGGSILYGRYIDAVAYAVQQPVCSEEWALRYSAGNTALAWVHPIAWVREDIQLPEIDATPFWN